MMTAVTHKGTISFVSHEKRYVTIEYISNGRKKVNANLDATGTADRLQTFRVGDTVSFRVRLSDRGDRMVAYELKFLYNPSLHLLIQKAHIENRFSGYLKVADEQYFVKEINNYLFFPLHFSRWEKKPGEKVLNEVINFRLLNLDNPEKLSAELFSHAYIPEYLEAVKLAAGKKIIEATVIKVSAYAVYLGLLGGQLQAKLPIGGEELAAGDTLKVIIKYISPAKIVVEKV